MAIELLSARRLRIMTANAAQTVRSATLAHGKLNK
jgi:hypothetical protein